MKGFRARCTGQKRDNYHPPTPAILVWESLVAPLGAPNRFIPLHLAPNISQDSPTCSQDRPRQPNLQPRSPKTAQLGLNMAILARFSSIWLPFRTPNLPKTFKNKLRGCLRTNEPGQLLVFSCRAFKIRVSDWNVLITTPARSASAHGPFGPMGDQRALRAFWEAQGALRAPLGGA